MKFSRFWAALTMVVLIGSSAFAQTTSNLTGRATMDGNPLPGVTVTISSPALQGVRTDVTDTNGNYNFAAIPPGMYTVRFEMESMQVVTRTAQIGLGQTGRADAVLRLSSVAEAITVTASAPAVLETTEVQTNIQADLIDDLPIGRTMIATTTLAPGVNSNGPNPGAITISGALASDNLFLVNGAVTNENLRGQPHNLFIEDAIQETTVQTAGISAEYGRFVGGVVSSITKSGGNEFTGSIRDTLNNDAWTADSQLQTVESLDEILPVYEGTLGGRIIRDRLWFFTAGRYFTQDRQNTFISSSVPFTSGREETRFEGKLTAQITPKHNVVGSYLKVQTDETENCFVACFEQSNLDTARALPNDFLVVRYNGILTSNFLLEGSYSKKKFAFEGSGGDSRDRITGTWGYDGASTGGFFGAPVFCGVCDPEERNNSTYGVKGTYYLAGKSFGTHSIVVGYENWAEERLSNNYQSGSDYGISVYSEEPFRDANGVIRPIIEEGDTIGYFPIALLSKGSDMVTDSLFFNDKWDLGRWQFNIGARYDKNDGKDSQGRVVADDDIISPRLGAMWDIMGNGRVRVNASYSKYVNRVAETIGGSSSAGGNPGAIYYEYRGPRISGLPTFDAFREAFRWFDSVGGLNNRDLIVRASVPGVNTQIRESLISPNVDEFAIGIGTQVFSNGYLRADYITREWKDFFVTASSREIGAVTDAFGNEFDLEVVQNSDDLERSYDALQFQAAFRLMNRFNVGGNYTYSETKGNQIGQTGTSGPVADRVAQYVEYKAFEQNSLSGSSCRIRSTKPGDGCPSTFPARSVTSTSAFWSALTPALPTRCWASSTPVHSLHPASQPGT
jgi:hypothetical protein